MDIAGPVVYFGATSRPEVSVSLLALFASTALAMGGGTTADCSSVEQALTCSSTITDTISTSAASNIDGPYTCGDPFAPLDQTGPDAVYTFECQAVGDVTLNITGLDCDVDIYILEDTCDPDAGCLAGSTDQGRNDDSITFPCVPGETYYVVIEGYGAQYTAGPGACGRDPDFTYTLFFDVSEGTGCPEDCTNGTDDDLDGDVDCSDSDCANEPTCSELCNGQDDDGDGQIDEGLEQPWNVDADGDGWGDPNNVIYDCAQPAGTVTNPSDCDDYNATRFPGNTDACDGVDNDCDTAVDENTECSDDDGDGFSELGGDCNDGFVAFSPIAEDVCNGADEDCDGAIDEGTECSDDDGDGYAEDEGDCNDGDASVNPGATEVQGDGIDNDCDGGVDSGAADPDDDGYDAAVGGDCEPFDASAYPGGTELADGVDNDCDGTVDEGTANVDDDGDGVSEADGDCDDGDAAVNPSASEEGNGRDDDCDGAVDEGGPNTDDDGDGYSEAAGDCDDDAASIYPGAPEQPNGIDDNCDGVADGENADLDGDGYTTADGDCDDEEGWVNPGLDEVCDGIDNDCDEAVDEDTPCDEGEITDEGGKCGCQTGPTGLSALWLLGLLALPLTRRR